MERTSGPRSRYSDIDAHEDGSAAPSEISIPLSLEKTKEVPCKASSLTGQVSRSGVKRLQGWKSAFLHPLVLQIND